MPKEEKIELKTAQAIASAISSIEVVQKDASLEHNFTKVIAEKEYIKLRDEILSDGAPMSNKIFEAGGGLNED